MENPQTQEFKTLQEIQTALEEEERIWQQSGMNLNPMHPVAISNQLLDLSTRVQTLTNLLITKGVVSEEEVNFEYKVILLNNRRIIRENMPNKSKDQIRKQILDGAKVNLQSIKPPWEN